MSGQYFYRDPLAAAWMAKHFGMRFVAYFPATDRTKEVLLPAIETHIHTGHLQIDGRFAIHPDSLPLLGPKVGDVLYTRINSGAVSIEEIMSDERQSVAGYLISRGGRIIQRDDLPFIWPECEA